MKLGYTQQQAETAGNLISQAYQLYYDYKNAHPEHDQNQLAWFREQYDKGTLLWL
ncbi:MULTISPECIES: hypothetical protein [unclassified Nostoc]|uniref:hypothetical protein n=1 Tax=unclassified Nostoc TaxID=2593658 RepID=UPI0015E2C2AF|nr:hypothetical protein [Nostoc sp. 'Peltigera membranacea cyanobiont' N6]